MTEMGHIAYQSIRLANTNVLTPIPRLYLFFGQKLLANDSW